MNIRYNNTVKQRLINLLHSEGFRESLVTTFGNYGGTTVSAIALIIFSRVLGPDNFGIFSTAFALALLIARLADFGFNLALQRELAKGLSGRESLVQSVALMRLVVILSIAILGLWLSPFLTFSVFKLSDPAIIPACMLLVGITIGFDYFTVVIQSERKFLASSLLIFAQAVLKMFGALLLFLTQTTSPLIAVIVYLASPVVGIIYGIVAYGQILFRASRHIQADLGLIWQSAKWISLSIVAAAVSEHADVLITKAYFSNYETGQFAAAARIAMFLSLIGLSVGTVLSVRVARYHLPVHLKRYMKKAVVIALLAFGLTLLAIPLARTAILFTVGDKYLSSVGVLTLLTIATALANATTPLAAVFYLFNRPQYYTYTGLLLTATLIGLDLLVIPAYGIIGAAWVRILVRIMLLVFTVWYVRRSYLSHMQNYGKN